MATQWEYSVLKLSTQYGFFTGTDFNQDAFNQCLNEYGAKGWELVSIFDINAPGGDSKFVLAALKRPKAQPPTTTS